MKSLEKKREEKAWQLYLARYQHMTKENYMPFDEFYSPTISSESDKSEKEILEDVKGILNAFKKEGEINGNI
ncbi:hypothetical protein FZC76_06830 [Sutcliffiella horikoshii]|uniref:Uncharacterized protein n=1 Tax=Sutcliffiella horikoshii TaxID=79883 RepID=A0A5D4T3C5_9BACI|nr:hypothetical protein [Sutcliffiella horikoshii]TYS68656.1 hypothetical protein FZC76_06830 [Sutcliffiella horikoshii]